MPVNGNRLGLPWTDGKDRMDETGETDTRRDGSQVGTTQGYASNQVSRPNEYDHAEREDEAS